MVNLIPPDLERCQAMKPNGANAFTLGGRPEMVQCTKKPSVIIYEVKPAKDGQKGSMSLCADCLKQFNFVPAVRVEVIR